MSSPDDTNVDPLSSPSSKEYDSSSPESLEFVDALSSDDSSQSPHEGHAPSSPSAPLESNEHGNQEGTVQSATTGQRSLAPWAEPSKQDDLFAWLPCIKAGFQVKQSAGRVDSWINMVLTLDGRDKATKFLQYAARLLAWYYMGTAQHERFASLKQSLTNSRKAFRLGRSIIEMHRLKEQQKKISGNLPSLSSSRLADRLLYAARFLGLAGFWVMDNTSFLAASGMWDNLQSNKTSRMTRRKSIQTKASKLANQSYFVSSIAGFWINWKALQAFRTKHDKTKLTMTTPEECTKLRAKYFALCATLLKSVVDILVFSNNAGVDLWMRYRGTKMNELIHCIFGLTSASVVLYKNYPEY